jgi:hypothetical protein
MMFGLLRSPFTPNPDAKDCIVSVFWTPICREASGEVGSVFFAAGSLIVVAPSVSSVGLTLVPRGTLHNFLSDQNLKEV